MVQFRRAHFDASFGALADATRRGVLEQAGLVTTEKVGRVRTCRLGRRGLHDEAAWIVEEVTRKERVVGRKKRK